MFETTIAGSLPKPAWLAEPNKLWAPWRMEGAALSLLGRYSAASYSGLTVKTYSVQVALRGWR